MSHALWCLVLACAAAPPVETSAEATTHLYVRTTPSGAQILLDGKELGTSPGVFAVRPGQRRRLVIELDGQVAEEQQITIRDGRITRIELTLTPPEPATASARPANVKVESRSVSKKVSDFPETVDLSTPESACAAFHRAGAAMDADAVVDLCWVTIDPREMRFWTSGKLDGLATYNKAQLEAEVLEVLSYKEELAAVVSRLGFPRGVSRHPTSLRTFGRIDGKWKNLGEDRCSSPEVAAIIFSQNAERHWQSLQSIRERLAAGQTDGVESRSVGKKVSDFPEPVDLSTPESACAADYRYGGSSDGATLQDLCWEIIDPEKRKEISTVGRSGIRTAGMRAQLEAAEILEVLNYGEDFAAVISRRSSPPDEARNMLCLQTFGRIDHEWKLVSREPSSASLETATSTFLEKKDRLLQRFQEIRKALAADQMTDVESRSVGKDVQSRSVGKKVSDFPEPVDLSSPESACSAFHRASAAMDADAVVDLCWVTVFPDTDMKATWTLSKADDLADYNKAQLEAEILEVLSYGEELAAVVSRLEFPPGVSRHPISLRTFGRIDGEWKNLGEDRCSSLEVATTIFSQSADRHRQRFLNIRDARAAVLVAAPGFAWKPLPDARQPLAFGPVIERVVNDAGNSLIDFDTGKVLSPPVKENLAGKSLTEWIVEAGGDALGGPRYSVSGLRGIDMLVMPISSEKWDGISRNDVPRAMMGRGRLARLIHIDVKGDLPATFFFNTREGGMGLLQILEFTEEPKGVRIRYKLLEPGERKEDVARAAAPMAGAGPAKKPRPTADKPLAFGPVIERVVNDDDPKLGNFLIDFDTGKFLSPPIEEMERAQQSLEQWIVEAGVDAFGETKASVRGLMGVDMIVIPISSNGWDRISPNDVAEAVGFGRPGRPIPISGKGELPATFIFQTREGGMGVLQILGFTEKPQGVKIRYKLVGPREWKGDVAILTFAVDREEAADEEAVDIEDLFGAIGRRLNRGWVGWAEVRRVGRQKIEVIAFTTDPEQVRRIERLIESPGTIEFRILANDRDHKEIIDRAQKDGDRRVLNPDGSLAAWWVPVALGQEESSWKHGGTVTRQIREDDRETSEVLVVEDPFDVTDAYLVEATSAVDSSGRPCVGFTFDTRGGQLLGGLTGANLPDKSPDNSGDFSRHLGIILNGKLHSAPAIRSTIHDRGEITGDFTREEVEDLVDVLNAGPLPTPLEKVSEVRTSQ